MATVVSVLATYREFADSSPTAEIFSSWVNLSTVSL